MSQELNYQPEAADPVVTPLLENPEECVNTITHGAGWLLSMAGAAAMLPYAVMHGTASQLLGAFVFCATMIGVYAASTLSHAIQQPERKRIAQIWDQGLIYLMIAGAYTPFLMSFVEPFTGSIVLVCVWLVAGFGFFSKIFFAHRIDRVAIWLYVALGWIPACCVKSVFQLAPVGALTLILAGGLCYTLGVVFLIWDKKQFHFHAIWHLLVIAGSTCHFVAVFQYTL